MPWLGFGTVVAAYIYAGIYLLAHSNEVTMAFALALVALAVRRYLTGRGPVRRASANAFATATRVI